MSIELHELKHSGELRCFVAELQSRPEWTKALIVRESAVRIISIRGRLLGENPQDRRDLQYDINSYKRLNFTSNDIESSLRLLVNLETAYYQYATRHATWQARKYGHSDREDDYIDTAKDLVAWSIWYRWQPRLENNQNHLHPHIIKTLDFIPQLTYHSYLKNTSISGETMADENPISPFEKKKEDPIYRLRKSVNQLPLEQIFTKLVHIPNMERLAILCVMGYVPGVDNITQGIKRFGVDTVSFRDAFDRGLDKLHQLKGFGSVDAHNLVEEAVNNGVIKDHNAKSAFFNSPRIELLELNNPSSLNETNLRIWQLARDTVDGRFRYSLKEIGDLTGGLSKISVAKRIRRIVDHLKETDKCQLS